MSDNALIIVAVCALAAMAGCTPVATSKPVSGPLVQSCYDTRSRETFELDRRRIQTAQAGILGGGRIVFLDGKGWRRTITSEDERFIRCKVVVA